MHNGYQLSETQRRLHQLLHTGVVVAVDAETAQVKLDDGELVTDWIPYITPGFGGMAIWSLPPIGARCLLLAADADWAHAVALPLLAEPRGEPHEHIITFSDGTSVEYNTLTHTLVAMGASRIQVTCPTIELVGNVNIAGNIAVSGTATINGKDFASHIHSGVQRGTASTDPVA